MKMILKAAALLFMLGSTAMASEPFKEMTVGVPVKSITEAEAWYKNFLGSDVEIMRPVPGVIELKASNGVWIQLFEVEDPASAGAILRFLVDDMESAQAARAAHNIDTGEAVVVPEVVTFSEFADPDGNGLGFYALP